MTAETADQHQTSAYLLSSQEFLLGKRVLIVVDNASSRGILTQLAKHWGLLVSTAPSVGEGLLWIQNNPPPDLCILDSNQPGPEYQSLVAALGHGPNKGAVPLITLIDPGRLAKPKTEIGRSRSMVTLTKPTSASDLYDALLSLFGDATDDRQSVSQPDATEKPAESHPLRILLAEDNLINQKVAQGMLKRLGYRADVAANGLEALESLHRQAYDVVLMDIQMPEMDGVEATQRIRQSFDVQQQPRIIAMTAHALSGDQEKFLEAGMDDYLSKPVHATALARALERCQPLNDTD